jgi:hypothetical protein
VKAPTPAPGTTPAERRKKLRENQEYFSSKLSDLVRYVGFGLVAASFGLLSKSEPLARTLAPRSVALLEIAALCGCLTILLDGFQLLAGWRSSSLQADNKAGDFQATAGSSRWRHAQEQAFILKVGAALAGSALLIAGIIAFLPDPLHALRAGNGR